MAKIRSTAGHNYNVSGIGIITSEFVEISDDVAKQFVGRSGFEVTFGKLKEVAEPIMAAELPKPKVPAGVLGIEGKVEKPNTPTEGSADTVVDISLMHGSKKIGKLNQK